MVTDDVRCAGNRAERATFARRVIPLLPEAEQKKATARLAVFNKASNARALMNALPSGRRRRYRPRISPHSAAAQGGQSRRGGEDHSRHTARPSKDRGSRRMVGRAAGTRLRRAEDGQDEARLRARQRCRSADRKPAQGTDFHGGLDCVSVFEQARRCREALQGFCSCRRRTLEPRQIRLLAWPRRRCAAATRQKPPGNIG